jgi:hypothetical protein
MTCFNAATRHHYYNIFFVFVFFLKISSDEPKKVDSDVFMALGEDFIVDESKFPFVSKWFNAVKMLNSKTNTLHKHFRLFTPKLKAKNLY